MDYRRLGLTPPDHLPRHRIPVALTTDRAGRIAAGVQAGPTPPPSPAPPPDARRARRTAATFRRFIRPFRGPATRHLPAYLAWFGARGSRPASGRRASSSP